jgi:hypothetical protein
LVFFGLLDARFGHAHEVWRRELELAAGNERGPSGEAHVFGMVKRHRQKASFEPVELPVESLVERFEAELESASVAVPGLFVSAEGVARELVEHEDERESSARRRRPRIELAPERCFDGREKARMDLVVEGRSAGEPAAGVRDGTGFALDRLRKPEPKHLFGGGEHGCGDHRAHGSEPGEQRHCGDPRQCAQKGDGVRDALDAPDFRAVGVAQGEKHFVFELDGGRHGGVSFAGA